jgi:hypothetical protein
MIICGGFKDFPILAAASPIKGVVNCAELGY